MQRCQDVLIVLQESWLECCSLCRSFAFIADNTISSKLLLTIVFLFRRGWQNDVASGWHSAYVGRLVGILQSVNNEYDPLLCVQINCRQGWFSNNYDSINPLNLLLPNMLYATSVVILPYMPYMQTLPKAQRTRGLSSYHKFKHKS